MEPGMVSAASNRQNKKPVAHFSSSACPSISCLPCPGPLLAKQDVAPLPQLPARARYIHYTPACSDWGIIGWALGADSGSGVDSKAYTHFVFLSSAMRGPYLPSYVRPRMHWTEPLIRWV